MSEDVEYTRLIRWMCRVLRLGELTPEQAEREMANAGSAEVSAAQIDTIVRGVMEEHHARITGIDAG